MLILLMNLWLRLGYSAETLSFSDYLQQFKTLVHGTGRYAGRFDIENLPKPFIGFCYHDNPWRIRIDYTFWFSPNVPIDDKRSLIFHELTHCVLGADHSNDPNNYMYFQIHHLTPKELDAQVTARVIIS